MTQPKLTDATPMVLNFTFGQVKELGAAIQELPWKRAMPLLNELQAQMDEFFKQFAPPPPADPALPPQQQQAPMTPDKVQGDGVENL